MRRPLPYLFFFAVLWLTLSLACSLSSEEPATPTASANVDPAVIEAAVATVQAQLAKASEVGGQTTAVPSSWPAAGTAADLEAAFVNIYQQVNPSVVEIFTFIGDNPLGSGSGFVYDDQGRIVTNNHVVAQGNHFEVFFAGGAQGQARLLGADVDSDLAVIEVDFLPEGAQPLRLGDSSALHVGQLVVALGSPFQEQGSMSTGIVSGLGRSLESQRGDYTLPQVIQTDAPINPGNSGGPLLNLQGEVIGVNSAIRSATGVNSGVGFAIPVNAVKRIAPSLIANGSYTYPFMGVRMQAPDPDLLAELGLPPGAGAYVAEVTPGSPAEAAGLQGGLTAGGDLIIAIDGYEIQSSDDLISYLIFQAEVGQTVELTVIRDGQMIAVPLTLGARP
ncbi:MAG: trypsin-like peptidase domain-containing protein [Chloroflexota bacterium]